MAVTEERMVLECDGARIAVRRMAGKTPGVVWLGGFRSDMAGTKAETLAGFCRADGRAFLRHDYSGHGESSGDYREGSISRWIAESLAVLRGFSQGPQVLVGSSMGGWIALRIAQELAKAGERERLGGLLLLAPAPDFTSDLIEPNLTGAERAQLAQKGWFEEPSQYSDEGNVFTQAFLADGRTNRVLGAPLDPGCPVRILQGMADPDVPHAHALKLMDHLALADATLTLMRDGDHRLSRPQDLALLQRTLRQMLDDSVAK